MANAGTRTLIALTHLLDLARQTAEQLGEQSDPSHIELMSALATSQLCALRIAAEQNLTEQRTEKKRRC